MWARRVAHLDRTKGLGIIFEYRSTSYVYVRYRFHTFYPANARGTAPDPVVGRPPVGTAKRRFNTRWGEDMRLW